VALKEVFRFALNHATVTVIVVCWCVQVCLFDLDYGLPVQVRDTALGIEKEEIPESDVGKEFQLNEQIQRGQTESAFGGGGRPNDMLQQLARTTPYYKVSF
jgi:pre-mRNA-splicing factor RBM22/SLT11